MRERPSAKQVAAFSVTLTLAVLASCDPRSCNRQDPQDASTAHTGSHGGAGSTFTAQCSGWFPDWITPSPPPPGSGFQLSQGYPLGVPVLETTPDNQIRIARWDPFSPSTSTTESPWLAHDFHVASERAAYLDSLKNYFLEGNVEVGFDVQRNTHRSWYHVPMMTGDDNSRREPYHGLTKERALRSHDHKWIIDAPTQAGDLESFAIGAYNWLGGYTIGQVFGDPNPALADPAKGKFISGAYVFKLLFAEYDPAKIDSTQDPLTDSPEWQVLDVGTPSAPLKRVRLLQVDVAVRDSRSAQTGWVFATFVYDKTMTSETSPWRRLRPVGVMWGDDPDVTGPGIGAIDETWLASGLPANLLRQDGATYGRDGRLNGPVDNKFSSCISCHSTAQVVVGAATLDAFRGVDLFPPPPNPTTCPSPMVWFRNVPAGTPFGVMTNGGNGCALATPPTATPPLHSVDYSLQLADALQSSFVDHDPNPCAAGAASLRNVDSPIAKTGDRAAAARSLEALRVDLKQDRLRDISRPAELKLPTAVTRKSAPEALRVKAEAPSAERAAAADKAARDRHRR